jgi:hypothetical protein
MTSAGMVRWLIRAGVAVMAIAAGIYFGASCGRQGEPGTPAGAGQLLPLAKAEASHQEEGNSVRPAIAPDKAVVSGPSEKRETIGAQPAVATRR